MQKESFFLEGNLPDITISENLLDDCDNEDENLKLVSIQNFF